MVSVRMRDLPTSACTGVQLVYFQPLHHSIHSSAWKECARKSAYRIPHRRLSGRGQAEGSTNGPGIDSSPCAAFHLPRYSSSSSVRDRGSPSSVKNVLTWLS